MSDPNQRAQLIEKLTDLTMKEWEKHARLWGLDKTNIRERNIWISGFNAGITYQITNEAVEN